MSRHYDLSTLSDEIANCMRCGNCQAACPYYRETFAESSVARGRIRLARAVRQGEIPPTPVLAGRLECLNCYACMDACPCGIKIDQIFIAARAELIKNNYPMPFLRKVMVHALKNQKSLDLCVKVATRLNELFFRQAPGGGQRPRFPVGLEIRRVAPPLAKHPFREAVEETISVPGAKIKVGFFTGCLVNYVYPSTGRAVVDILARSGVAVVTPRTQHCCGVPLLLNGSVIEAEVIARRHVDLFSELKLDAIVVACGTCGEAFKKKYVNLLEGAPGYAAKAKTLAEKTYDIAEYICKTDPFYKKRLQTVNQAVTYHEACHLDRGMGVTSEPLEILKSIPGVNLISLNEPARCCGNAGSFSLSHYDFSYRILKRKLDDIEGTGADIVVTGCSACRMHLEDGINQERLGKKVFHTAELIAMAYGHNAGIL